MAYFQKAKFLSKNHWYPLTNCSLNYLKYSAEYVFHHHIRDSEGEDAIWTLHYFHSYTADLTYHRNHVSFLIPVWRGSVRNQAEEILRILIFQDFIKKAKFPTPTLMSKETPIPILDNIFSFDVLLIAHVKARHILYSGDSILYHTVKLILKC